MSASFPGSIADLRTVDNRNGVVYDADKKSVLFAEDINAIIAEVEALETEFGINPAGTFDDVADRLDDIDARVAGRVSTVASSATPTPPGDDCDMFTITALAVAAELQTPSGTPFNGQKLIIRIKDDGTSRALTYTASYRAIGVSLPAATISGKELYLGCIYNSASSKWEVVAVAIE